MNNKQKSKASRSGQGIALLIIAAITIAVLGLVGMYKLGVISVPEFLSDILDKPQPVTPPPVAGNIAPKDNSTEYYEALPREEYASALADINLPEEYYRMYSISLFSGDNVRTTDYVSIYNHGDWWVQSSENDVILSTVISKGGVVKLSDHADNTSVTTASAGFNYSEYFGYTPLSVLTDMIYALANGEDVEYVSGISDFSLSFTQARGTGENVFSFNFKRIDGFSEEYTFAFESATILSAAKYSPSGEKIYQMEMKDSRNSIEDIDVDALFVID